MRIWYSNDFTGIQPTGTALIVCAEARTKARRLAAEELKSRGLEFDGTLQEVIPSVERVIMLSDGDY